VFALCFLDKERFRIQLDAADGSPTVKQLAEQISDVTKIPVANQRLICKGEMNVHGFYLQYLHFWPQLCAAIYSNKHLILHFDFRRWVQIPLLTN